MKTLKKFLIVLLVISTAIVVIARPHMHKPIQIQSATFAFEDDKLDTNAKEDKIAWNSWHSIVGNKILNDKKVPPDEELNTINMIQFNVDNQRNISNIKISTDPQKYMQMARTYYIDYLNGLNGNPVLAFPKNSQRKVVTVKMLIKSGKSMKYASPQDFSDYETVRK